MFSQLHDELRAHLRCSNPRHTKDSFCWKPKRHNNKCIPVPAELISQWAAHIEKGSTTIHHPPDTVEFADLEKSVINGKNKRINDIDNIDPGLQRGQIVIVQGGRSNSPSPRPNSPELALQTNPLADFTSPVKGYTATQYDRGIEDFINWCMDELTDPKFEWVSIGRLLRERNIGIDVLKSAIAFKDQGEFLLGCLSRPNQDGTIPISDGNLCRLLPAFKRWLKTKS
jgi:hypothetical protein